MLVLEADGDVCASSASSSNCSGECPWFTLSSSAVTAILKFSAFFRDIALAFQGLVGCGPTRESTGDTAGIYARSGTGGDASDGDFSA